MLEKAVSEDVGFTYLEVFHVREGLDFCVIPRDQMKIKGVETLKRQFLVSYNDFLMVEAIPDGNKLFQEMVIFPSLGCSSMDS